MIRATLAFLVAAGTAALFCVARMRGMEVPARTWLGVMSTVGDAPLPAELLEAFRA